jgi:hypothetical protein
MTLTFISLSITYIVSEKTISKINILQNKISDNHNLINNKWNHSKSFEQRINTSILMLMGPKRRSTAGRINDLLGIDYLSNLKVEDLISIRDMKIKTLSAEVDNIYLEVLDNRQQITSLEATNESFKVISLITYILGLILILSRHLFHVEKK